MLLPIKCHSGFAWTSGNNAVNAAQLRGRKSRLQRQVIPQRRTLLCMMTRIFTNSDQKTDQVPSEWCVWFLGFILRGPFFKLCFWLGWNCGDFFFFFLGMEVQTSYICVCDSGSCVECQHSVSYLFPIPAVSKGQHADFKWIMRRVVDVDRGHRWCHGSSVAVDGSRGRSRVRIQQLPGWRSGALSTAPFPGVCAIWAVLTLVMG